MSKRVISDLLTSSNGGIESVAAVGDRYETRDGLLLRGVGRVVRKYNPFAEAGLPDALARVSTGDASPIEFASEFGLLGYNHLVRRTLPGFPAGLPTSSESMAAHAAYLKYIQTINSVVGRLPEGDPVKWLEAHSRTVALCLEFIGLWMEGDLRAIGRAVERVSEGPYAQRDRIVSLPVEDWRNSRSKESIIRRQICHLLEENIAGVRRLFDTDGRHSESFFWGTTIEAVYWQIADHMEAKSVRRCRECRRFFLARDKRQQYCPALPGSGRSRCSSRLNVRNHRHRK